MPSDSSSCLNCGATLVGRFCASCGQRVVPPHPTVRELSGDAWHELSGYDGRIAATFRDLVRPGRLTRRYIEGQRARYLSPIRLYLIVSVIYFVVAASAPQLDSENGRRRIGPGISFSGVPAASNELISAEERAEVLAQVNQAPWILRPLLRAVAENPEQFRARLFTTMPRVFFGMLPVFAGIVALFYRGQTFPTSLVFSAHIHAFAFVVLAIGEAIKFSRSTLASFLGATAGLIVLLLYMFLACRTVFGGGRLATIGKMAGIGVLYLLASIPAFLIILLWAALS